MKRIFMPSMDELYQMQDMGVNVYKYLMVKAIETLALDGINYPNKGMLKSAYKYFQEDPYIASAICMMYPDEIKYSQMASTDVDLCLKIIGERETDKCNLDCLSMFDSSVLINTGVLEKTILKLKLELVNNPKYRFEYKDSELLRKIFNREITDDDLVSLGYIVNDLLDIEPAYGLSLGSWHFENDEYDRPSRISKAVNSYANTYGIPNYVGIEYLNKDIFTSQSTEIKRLLKCINRK